MKAGADDYLVAHGPGAFRQLLDMAWAFNPDWNDIEAEVWWQVRGLTPETPKEITRKRLAALTPVLAKFGNLEGGNLLEELRKCLKLRAGDLADLKADIKVARKSRGGKEKAKGKTPELKDLEEGFRLHPAIDFLGECMSIGFRVDLSDNETGLLFLISDGQGVKDAVAPETVEIGERVYQVPKKSSPPFLRDVWTLKRLKKFIAHPLRPPNLYGDLMSAYKSFLDLPESAYGLLAAWTVGTYYAHLFTAFPFLHFHGPKESGKSKSLEALRCVCFNAWKGRDITAAALGDTADGQRGTLLLDQAEKLNNDQENGNLIGLLADSYKKAGGNRRVVEITKGGRSVLEFSTYGPKAFASTKPLDPDLTDRCVKIPMTRTRKRLPDLEGWEPVWSELRDKLYRFILAAFKEVQTHYQAISGDGTRIGELWRPLGAVLNALGVEQGEIGAIRTLFMQATEETRHEPNGWECTLLEVLRDEAQPHLDRFELTVTEILTAMNIEGDKKPGGKWVGDTISNYHLAVKKTRPRIDGRQTTAYTFDPVRVKELCAIYFRETPLNDVNSVHNVNYSNDNQGLQDNKGNPCSRTDVHGTGGNGESVHDCSRTENTSCTTQHSGIVNENDRVQDVQEESGGIEENYSHFFGGEEVPL
jgi:hypothetical protein